MEILIQFYPCGTRPLLQKQRLKMTMCQTDATLPGMTTWWLTFCVNAENQPFALLPLHEMEPLFLCHFRSFALHAIDFATIIWIGTHCMSVGITMICCGISICVCSRNWTNNKTSVSPPPTFCWVTFKRRKLHSSRNYPLGCAFKRGALHSGSFHTHHKYKIGIQNVFYGYPVRLFHNTEHHLTCS